MRPYLIAIGGALSLFAFCACSSATTTGVPLSAPASRTALPLANSVVVTATHAGNPIPHLEITLRRNTWPGGRLIAKGSTGPRGRVTLSGNWTAQEVVCAGGKYYTRSGYIVRYKCQQPFPKNITLDF